MAKIKVKLRELKDASVHYISLVDRAASRIPFRVMKRDEENMIDLGKVFKNDMQAPVIATVAVVAQKNADTATKVQQSIAQAGLSTATVQKSDEDTLVFSQGPQTGGEIVMVRLSDQMVVGVRHLPEIDGVFKEYVEEKGFYPDLDSASVLFGESLQECVHKAEDTKPLIDSYYSYLRAMMTIPQVAFKADNAVCGLLSDMAKAAEKEAEVAKKAEDAQKAEQEKVSQEAAEAAKKADAEVAKNDMVCKGCGEKVMVEKDGTKVCKCTTKEDTTVVKDEVKAEAVETVTKSDITAILTAITGMQTSLTAQQEQLASMTTKVEGVVETVTTTSKRLDEVVKKTDTLQEKVAGTVAAPPRLGDRTREPVIKKENEGNFLRDPAYLMGRRRR